MECQIPVIIEANQIGWCKKKSMYTYNTNVLLYRSNQTADFVMAKLEKIVFSINQFKAVDLYCTSILSLLF